MKENSNILIEKSSWLSVNTIGKMIINLFLRSSALISILITAAICIVLVVESSHFLEAVSITDFLFKTEWSPLIEPRKFGVLPIVWGSLLISGMAISLSIPIGLSLAVYLAEYASAKTKKIVKPLIELLAGIPSIVFGFLAITVVTPILRYFLPETDFFNALSASIVVTAMILPTIVTLSDDAISSVPQALRDAGFALATTKSEIVFRQVIPAAMSGIIASIVLAFSRAIGETMAVTLAAGATPNITLNMLESVQTMTAFIVQASMGDTPHGTIEYYSLFAVAGLLFLITLSLNIFSKMLTKNVRRKFS